MTKKKIILGVKIDKPEIKVAKQRPIEAYSSILGDPIINEDAKYLNILVFDSYFAPLFCNINLFSTNNPFTLIYVNIKAG